MFKRLHARDAYPGSGVGLAVCRKIVEGMGGRIWVEPAPGGGSIFSFTVPLRPRPRTAEPLAATGEGEES